MLTNAFKMCSRSYELWLVPLHLFLDAPQTPYHNSHSVGKAQNEEPHCPGVEPLTSGVAFSERLISRSLSFLTYKTEVEIVPTSLDC